MIELRIVVYLLASMRVFSQFPSFDGFAVALWIEWAFIAHAADKPSSPAKSTATPSPRRP